MSLYKGNAAKDAGNGGGQYSPGGFKFKVVSSGMNDWGNLNFELKTWSEDGKEGPKILDTLRFSTESEAMKAEVDRRLTVMLGKPEIEAEGDIVGKTGYVILRKGPKYLEPASFGGYFTTDRKSATGNADSILEAIQAAIEYDWTKDDYAVQKNNKANGGAATSAPSTPEDDSSMPF